MSADGRFGVRCSMPAKDFAAAFRFGRNGLCLRYILKFSRNLVPDLGLYISEQTATKGTIIN
jgi:hypothetical protein